MTEAINRALICVPIVEQSDESIENEIEKVIEKTKTKTVDIVEFRADYYENLSDYEKLSKLLEKIKARLNEYEISLLFTIRSANEGGEKLDFLEPTINEINLFVAEYGLADIVDVELYSDDMISEIIDKAHRADVKIIISNHDFEKTPSYEILSKRYEEMDSYGPDFIKIAVMPKSNEDVDTLLECVTATNKKVNSMVVGISMGELGKRTRTEGYKFGSVITFAALNKASAPGQVSVDDL